jgi:hypothetical protein
MEIEKTGFIRVEITDEMMATAKAKAKDLGVLKNSIRGGGGNLAGFLGEEMVLASFPESESANTYQHDVKMMGATFEVKSKDRTVDPRLDYDASVANFNTSQRADFYVFTSVFRNKATGRYTHGHIVGLIPKEQYKSKATFLRVGDIDPSNGWEVKAACYNLAYRDLERFN